MISTMHKGHESHYTGVARTSQERELRDLKAMQIES